MVKTYNRLYAKLCSPENIYSAYDKARQGKSKKNSVINFDKDLYYNLWQLKQELIYKTYKPLSLKRFIVRDPKIRVIHASAFRDRIVHHAVVNILRPIYEKIFIHDSYATRKFKGTHLALRRFDFFKRRVSRNGKCILRGGGRGDSNSIQGYVLKCDIQHYFDNVSHDILLSILRKKIRDEDFIQLVKIILDNFDTKVKGKGMPLGNYTSQFFANVYLNELDYFIKHILKAKCYIRYVDDFVILHRSKRVLELHKERINNFLKAFEIKLHPDKSNITPLKQGVTLLGYRIFFYYKLLRRRNIRHFKRKFYFYLMQYKNKEINKNELLHRLQGWFGYAQWANTYNLRKKIIAQIEEIEKSFSNKD